MADSDSAEPEAVSLPHRTTRGIRVLDVAALLVMIAQRPAPGPQYTVVCTLGHHHTAGDATPVVLVFDHITLTLAVFCSTCKKLVTRIELAPPQAAATM